MSTRDRGLSANTGINLAVWDYLWRYKWLTLPLLMVLLVFRFVSGRRMFAGGRSTDATFWRQAREVRAGWYANQRGVVRLGLRCATLGALLLWAFAPAWFYVLLGLGAVWAVWAGLRRHRRREHDRLMVAPVWPAVAGIIGVPASQPGSRWVDIPDPAPEREDEPVGENTGRVRGLVRRVRRQPGTAVAVPRPDEPILVGLRAADAGDDRRVAELVRLFDQRYGRAHHGRIDHTRRLVLITPRPAEPAYWPSVARILDVGADALADRWMRVEYPPPGGRATGPRVTVSVPYGTPLEEACKALRGLLHDVYGGEWQSDDPRREARELVLYPRPPEPTPPAHVSLTDTPDYEWSVSR